MSFNIEEDIKLQMEELYEESVALTKTKSWQPYIEAIQEAKGSEMDERVLANTARMLENTAQWMKRMDESTRSVHVGSFIKHGFDLITAVMPGLIANDIVSVQPLKRRAGEIFFLEILYGTSRGGIMAGDQMFGAKVVGNGNHSYTSENVTDEVLGTGAGAGPYTGNLGDVPVIAGSLYVTDGVENFHDDGKGVLTGDAGGSGTINYSSGAFSVTFNTSVVAGVNVLGFYTTDFEANPSNVPEIILDIKSILVQARRRRLRILYSLDASHDLGMAFGKNPDVELSAAAASEIRMEIDTSLLIKMRDQAGITQAAWSSTVPADTSWRDHKFTLIDHLIATSNLIRGTTNRGNLTGIICGLDVMNVIESLEGRWRGEKKRQPGPHFAGMLDNWKVYVNPNYGAKEIVAYYKGDLWIEAGFVYAPYLPMYTTPLVMLDDFVARKGMATSAATKMVNSNFFVRTSIT